MTRRLAPGVAMVMTLTVLQRLWAHRAPKIKFESSPGGPPDSTEHDFACRIEIKLPPECAISAKSLGLPGRRQGDDYYTWQVWLLKDMPDLINGVMPEEEEAASFRTHHAAAAVGYRWLIKTFPILREDDLTKTLEFNLINDSNIFRNSSGPFRLILQCSLPSAFPAVLDLQVRSCPSLRCSSSGGVLLMSCPPTDGL